MKKIVYIFAFILPLLMSCKKNTILQDTVINDSLFQVITINPDNINKKEPGKISIFAESVEYIPLQTKDSMLVGEITRMIVWNGMYYIWDRLSEMVFCFDQNGRFSHRLCKQGEGPDEYFNIADFTLDRENGNMVVYSDRGRALYEYTSASKLVKKSDVPFIMSSLAVKGDWKYCYLDRLPNMKFYKDVFPESYRYVTLRDGKVHNQHLLYKFDENFLKAPLSSNNFTFYGDTILLTEFLSPEIFSIDILGGLLPRYRIEFTTNTYTPTFKEHLDLNKMREAVKEGKLTMLYGAFYENKDYLFFNYSRGLIGLAYVNKRDGSIHNLGYFLLDDFNQNTLSVNIAYVDEKYIYLIGEPELLLKKKANFSSYLKSICNNIQDFDNPVIIRIKLK